MRVERVLQIEVYQPPTGVRQSTFILITRSVSQPARCFHCIAEVAVFAVLSVAPVPLRWQPLPRWLVVRSPAGMWPELTRPTRGNKTRRRTYFSAAGELLRAKMQGGHDSDNGCKPNLLIIEGIIELILVGGRRTVHR